jgi:UDP-glucuronate 4-epimerase
MINPILVTGSAGFIGYHLAERLLIDGHTIIGIDNLNDYYDVTLKQARLKKLQVHSNFTFHHIDIEYRSSC